MLRFGKIPYLDITTNKQKRKLYKQNKKQKHAHAKFLSQKSFYKIFETYKNNNEMIEEY